MTNIADDSNINALIASLRDDNNSVRRKAANKLDRIPDWPESEEAKRQIPEFINALRRFNQSVRKVARITLNRINPDWPESEEARRQIPKFIGTLRDFNQSVRGEALNDLNKINPEWHKSEEAKRQVPELISALLGVDRSVRELAAWVLDRINPKWHKSEEARRQIPEFIGALRDNDRSVRQVATKFLELIDPEWPESEEARRQIPEFVISGGAYFISPHVLEVLVKIGIEPLIGALRDENPVIASGVINALEKIGNVRAVKPLVAAAKNKNSDVRLRAREVLWSFFFEKKLSLRLRVRLLPIIAFTLVYDEIPAILSFMFDPWRKKAATILHVKKKVERERPSKHNSPSVEISSVIRDLHSESPLKRRKAALTLKSIGRPAEAAAGRELFNMVKREALRDDSDQLAYNYGVEALDALGINRPF